MEGTFIPWFVFLAVVSIVMIVFVNKPKKKEICHYCHEDITDCVDHWCEEKIRKVHDEQLMRVYNHQTRKVIIEYWCPQCHKTRHRVILFNPESNLPDRTITKTSLCGPCERVSRV
jgi:hypothetical protein